MLPGLGRGCLRRSAAEDCRSCAQRERERDLRDAQRIPWQESPTTPAGVFALIEKDKDHHSTMHDDAWMPNMQRITWNGLALHGRPLPGAAASHACFRMPYALAAQLFHKSPIGMR